MPATPLGLRYPLGTEAAANLDTHLQNLAEDVEEFIAVPPGVAVEYYGDVAPPGWLLCDGSAVSRAAYPGLWAALGTKYGAGDGSTTFNLPDKRGRMAIGRNPAVAGIDTLGETGGAF